jgi:cytochrome c-type biogenesis protein CcmH
MSGGLAIIMAVLALAAAGLVAWPTLRTRSRLHARSEFDTAVYRDQLAEIERDAARGVIGAEESEAARIEVSRRLLAADAAGDVSDGAEDPRASFGRRVTFVLALALPICALATYFALGTPGLPSQPFAERTPAAPPAGPTKADLFKLAAMIEQRLKATPDELGSWEILSTLYVRLGRPEDAHKAHRRARTLAGGDAAAMARISVDYGEALMASAGGQVTQAARAAFARALDAMPKHPAARYYSGLAALQGGDARGALSVWVPLRSEAPKDAPWAALLDRRIARIKRETGLDPAEFK